MQPAPGTYDRHDGFDIKFQEAAKVGSRQFRDPIMKKRVSVNLHDPYAPADKKDKGPPGPSSYNVPRDFDAIPEDVGEDEEFAAPKFRHVIGGKVYTEDNNDRFGLPIRPMKPIELRPGPGDYHPNCE